jgi:hypothetical protein
MENDPRFTRDPWLYKGAPWLLAALLLVIMTAMLWLLLSSV